jgi:hypothetical protein
MHTRRKCVFQKMRQNLAEQTVAARKLSSLSSIIALKGSNPTALGGIGTHQRESACGPQARQWVFNFYIPNDQRQCAAETSTEVTRDETSHQMFQLFLLVWPATHCTPSGRVPAPALRSYSYSVVGKLFLKVTALLYFRYFSKKLVTFNPLLIFSCNGSVTVTSYCFLKSSEIVTSFNKK